MKRQSCSVLFGRIGRCLHGSGELNIRIFMHELHVFRSDGNFWCHREIDFIVEQQRDVEMRRNSQKVNIANSHCIGQG